MAMANPPSILSLSSFSSRRSHLDSASYRTLLRIYSLSLDQDAPPNPNPNPNPNSDFHQTGTSVSNPNPNQEPSQVSELSQFGKELENSLNDDVEEFDIVDGSIDVGLLDGIMLECAKLVRDDSNLDLKAKDREKGATFEKSEAEFGESDGGLIVETQHEVMVSSSCELNGKTVKELGEGTNQLKDVTFDESEAVGNPGEIGELDEGLGVETQKDGLKGETVNGIEEVAQGDVCDSAVDIEEMEEGEIPIGSDGEVEVEDKDSDVGSISEGFDKDGDHGFSVGACSNLKIADESAFSSLICDGKRSFEAIDNGGSVKSQTNAAVGNLGKRSSETENLEVQVRKKRAPLTVERKAKKKIAKRRKRAKKEREQGVKRLKLQPITKPKEIKYCNFFLQGRCQQGDKCKFSHDITPLTKSQPCKYFACNSCLKGDDCPFDHQLSKYPCHNYMSKGTCSRGDGCKFSHKKSTMESSTPEPNLSKGDLLLSPGKPNLINQLHMNRVSPNTIGQPKAITSSSQFLLHKPLAGNLVNDFKKPALNIPKGVRFHSFGNRPSDNGDKEKNNQQKIPITQSGKNELARELLSCAGTSSNASKESNSSSFVREKAGISSRSLQPEVSDALKKFEEILFCGGS